MVNIEKLTFKKKLRVDIKFPVVQMSWVFGFGNVDLVSLSLSAVDGDAVNESADEEDECDDDDDDDSDSPDSDREFRIEFKKYKAHYYTDKMDFERVTQYVTIINMSQYLFMYLGRNMFTLLIYVSFAYIGMFV